MLGFDAVTGARGERVLFSDLTFTLSPGDAAMITGPNGVGKSTLVRIAAGLLAPRAGRVTRTGDTALIAEPHALDPELPLARALAFWAGIDGRRAAVDPALAALGLAPIADVPVRMLSTGQRRRAGIARVVASGAAIWLLDEPANGLDSQAVETLAAIIADHRRSGGIALVATHLRIDLPEAQQITLAVKP